MNDCKECKGCKGTCRVEYGSVVGEPSDNLVKIIMDEIHQVEKIKGTQIKLNPIVDLYKTSDHRFFLSYTRDYLWFGDKYTK